MKTCTKCLIDKDESEFSKHSRIKSGLNPRCRACAKEYNDKWRNENREIARALSAAWYRNNPEKNRSYSNNWRKNNPAKNRALKAAYAENNKEQIKKRAAEYSKKYPEKARIRNANRRALKRTNGGNLSSGILGKLFALQRGKCACCGKSLGKKFHLDHILPIALGGKHVDSNVQLLRSTCNQQKHAKHPVDFMQSRGFLI